MAEPTDRTVLITGGSRNIGAHLAQRLASRGDRVAIVARSSDALAQVADRIRGDGGDILAVTGDIAQAEDIARIVATVEERWGNVDVLVNNAVGRLHKPFTETTDEELADVLGVILWGAMRLSRAVLPGMAAQKWGRIISMAGGGAEFGKPARAGQLIAKSAVIGMTQALAMEYARDGVTVNAISPDFILTGNRQWSSEPPDSDEARQLHARAAKVPVGRPGTMDEVAAVCELLISPHVGYITGQIFRVDGGTSV